MASLHSLMYLDLPHPTPHGLPALSHVSRPSLHGQVGPQGGADLHQLWRGHSCPTRVLLLLLAAELEKSIRIFPLRTHLDSFWGYMMFGVRLKANLSLVEVNQAV